MASHYDALVVGAGFSGIYQVYKLRQLGLTVKMVDAAPDFGGTWLFNRYPGASSDTESHLYRFSWDKEDLQTYPWQARYLKQQEVLDYLHHVVKRHDLRKHAQFETEVKSAVFDEATNLWHVSTTRGSFVVRYLHMCIGGLSSKVLPDIAGLETFKGETYHTGSWPDEGVDFTNKRVGVIGCGSTGTQIITTLAKEDKLQKLVSFQRSPQYSVPTGNRPITKEERESFNSKWDDIWSQVRGSRVCFGFEESQIPAMSVPEEERQRIFQEAWDKGNGFRFMFGTFSDITIDQDANDAAANFIKQKIRETVKDPEKARKLTPTEIYARRPICDSGYYQAFNNPKVDVVALKETPIKDVTPGGITTMDGTHHELDILIFATGFDAVDGSYARILIQGRKGETLQQHWGNGAVSYLGVAVAGFPNMFLGFGPHGPFTNVPPALETEVEFISDTIHRWRESDDPDAPIEVTKEAETAWAAVCTSITEGSLFHKTQSWIFGANVPGKAYATRFFFGGMKAYREKLDEVIRGGFTDFVSPPKGLQTTEQPVLAEAIETAA